MTFPTASISTLNLDASTDSPASARSDLLTTVQQLNSLRNWFRGERQYVAAGATVDIGGQYSASVHLSSGAGSTITSLGTNYNGPVWLTFGVACSMTHNATTLKLPRGNNHSFILGDVAICMPTSNGGASNGWQVMPIVYSGAVAIGPDGINANAMLTVGRSDTSSEGGQINLTRAGDGAGAFGLDVYTTGGVDYLRFLDILGGATRGAFDNAGNFILGALAVPTSPLDINGNRLRIRTDKTPASASDTGNQGEVCWDASYVYVCTATNTWKRAAIATW